MEDVHNTDSLVDLLRRHMGPIVESSPVLLAYLFGSAATHPTPLSDVDIALVTDGELSPGERLKLMLEVERELAERCGIGNADVRIINDAPLVFRGRVVSDGVLLYASDEPTRVEFETKTRDAYFDYLPTHRGLQEAFFADVKGRGLYGRQG